MAVTYSESRGIRVAKVLRDHGLCPCHPASGYTYGNDEIDDDPSTGIIVGVDGPWVGVLSFTAEKWTLSAYGRAYVALIKEFAKDISKAFDIDVNVILREENARKSEHKFFSLFS